jgi:hypothetical protein
VQGRITLGAELHRVSGQTEAEIHVATMPHLGAIMSKVWSRICEPLEVVSFFWHPSKCGGAVITTTWELSLKPSKGKCLRNDILLQAQACLPRFSASQNLRFLIKRQPSTGSR